MKRLLVYESSVRGNMWLLQHSRVFKLKLTIYYRCDQVLLSCKIAGDTAAF